MDNSDVVEVGRFLNRIDAEEAREILRGAEKTP